MADTPLVFSPAWPRDTRKPIDPLADERASLTSFLDWHRETFALKCSGLSDEQLSMRSVEPSSMSLHGLVRHLAGAERWWFRVNFVGEAVPILFYSDDDPDQDFADLTGDTGEAFALWRTECERSRAIVAASSLEAFAAVEGRRGPLRLRWILLHMIAEYARHNGHADLLRERIDGASGE